jgi:hypothetical protein
MDTTVAYLEVRALSAKLSSLEQRIALQGRDKRKINQNTASIFSVYNRKQN